MRAHRSARYRRAALHALRWCAWYTRGLDSAVATTRQDEVASDLHEHGEWAEAQGVGAARLARSIYVRMIAGAAADLSWRHNQRRAYSASVDARVRLRDLSFAVLLVVGLGLVAVGTYALYRVVRALIIGDISYIPATSYPTLLVTLAALTGVMTLRLRRSRSIGALLIAVPAMVLPVLVGQILNRVSASSLLIFNAMPGWDAILAIAGGGLAIFAAMTAIIWRPERRRATSMKGTGNV